MTLTLSDPQAARKTTTKRIEISNLGQVSGAFAAHLHTARPFPPAVMPREWAIDVRSHPSSSGAWSRRTFRQKQSPIFRCCCHQLLSLVWIHSLAPGALVIRAKKSAPEQKGAPRSKNGALLPSTYFSHYVVGTMAEASRANRRPPKPLPTLPLP